MSTGVIVLLVAILVVIAASAYALYRTRQAERANPPKGNLIDIDGVRLHYIERGEGKPLVLLHGNGSMIQDFDSSGIIDLVAKRYRVIVFDRPGYGHSTRPRGRLWGPTEQAELLYKALRRIGADRPIVVGHSWGTLVALALALNHRDYVRSLVLLSGYYFPTFRPDVALLSPPAIPVIGDVMRYTISPILGRLMWPGMLRIIFGPPKVPAHFSQFPVWMALRPKQLRASAAESGLMIPAVSALRRRYHELKMPVVIMAGANDRFVRAKRHSVRLHDEIPNSDLRLTPGAGHMVHHVAANDVTAAIDIAAKAAA